MAWWIAGAVVVGWVVLTIITFIRGIRGRDQQN